MIELKGVSKVYPNGVKALNNVSLTVDRGEFLVIIGLSGAGKSTLLRVINQLIPVSSGQVIVDGVRMDTARGAVLRNMRRKIGMIFQSFNIVKRMSVLSNVLSGRVGYHPTWRNVLGIYPEADKQIAYKALQRVDILEKVHNRASDLSGGQQQRVAIARALAQQPLIMLADEPVASLDPITTVQVMDFLKEICSTDGITTIANLHHVDLAWKYATRVVGVRAGEIVYDQRPSQTTKNQFIKDMEIVYGRPIQHDEFVIEEAI